MALRPGWEAEPEADERFLGLVEIMVAILRRDGHDYG
jgi:hypothetical protein